jgi:hypothetical protein
VNRAEPLEVPTGQTPDAEAWPDAEPLERLEQAADGWQEHGYRELPYLAWAVLDLAEHENRPELARHAREWAPSSPGVQLEVARLAWSPPDLLRSLGLVSQNFPSVVWIGTVGLAALGIGCLFATTVVVAFGFVRSLPLIGHALVHFWSQRPSGGGPGSLLVLCALSLLPLFGVGPVMLIAVLAAVTLTSVTRAYGVVVVILVSMSAVALGPGLERWAALATVPGPHSALLPAWRVERGQPLPGDRSLLEHRMSLGEATPVERLALAAVLKRDGRLEGVERLLADTSDFDRSLNARVSTHLGTVRLARGEVREAIQAFNQARSVEESAPVLYNLAQANGRALELKEQTQLFSEAKRRDSELISRAADYLGTNVHRFLLELPVPLDAYFVDALEVGPDSQLLAADVRSWTLGRRVPQVAWFLLPALPILGLLFRIRGVNRCVRCFRSICNRCGPAAAPGPTCLRCRRLSTAEPGIDPRVRQLEQEREQRRRRTIQLRRMLIGLAVPGGAHLLQERAVAGGLILLPLLVGCALLVTSERLPAPTDLGRLATVLPLAVASILMVPALLAGVLGALRAGSEGEARR